METNITKDQILDLILENVDIRGIELSVYRPNFEEVAEKILELLKEKSTSYYSFEKDKMIELKQ